MYKKILVPLDGSEFAECSLQHVKAIAVGCSVPEVVLLRALEPFPQAAAVASEIGEDWQRNAEKLAYTDAEGYLSKVVDALESDGVNAKSVIVKGRSAEAILDYADKNQVDLIVLSTHGSSGIVRWVMGSVADRVMRHSKTPVLLVTPAACRIS